MAWEKRPRGGRYYYRCRRVGKRIVKEYLGRGPKAEQAAEEDARKRQARRLERLAIAEQRRRHDAALAVSRQFGRETERLARLALAAAGYHQHHRHEWRKRRVRNQPE
jgi:hypothetical protein